ncbi:Hypothetical predicted protein, partial [Podarcis lilfordi]
YTDAFKETFADGKALALWGNAETKDCGIATKQRWIEQGKEERKPGAKVGSFFVMERRQATIRLSGHRAKFA